MHTAKCDDVHSKLRYRDYSTNLFKNFASHGVDKAHARTVNDHVMNICQVATAGLNASVSWPNSVSVAMEICCTVTLAYFPRTIAYRQRYASVITYAMCWSQRWFGVNMAVGTTNQGHLALKVWKMPLKGCIHRDKFAMDIISLVLTTLRNSSMEPRRLICFRALSGFSPTIWKTCFTNMSPFA